MLSVWSLPTNCFHLPCSTHFSGHQQQTASIFLISVVTTNKLLPSSMFNSSLWSLSTPSTQHTCSMYTYTNPYRYILASMWIYIYIYNIYTHTHILTYGQLVHMYTHIHICLTSYTTTPKVHSVTPIIVGALRIILKKMEKRLGEHETRGRIEIIQTATLLISSRILITFLRRLFYHLDSHEGHQLVLVWKIT